MLRNPYIPGVERFEAPFFASEPASEPSHRIEQAAHFCLLLWQQFQPELRAVRYTLTCDHLSDSTLEFAQQPRYDELIHVDTHDAQQIDIEFVSQQSAITSRDQHTRFGQQDEHFPAFLEVFIPLRPNYSQPETPSHAHFAEDHLVIWCRPSLLPKVTTLWERAATFLINQS